MHFAGARPWLELAEMVQAWEAWEATVSLCYTDKDMPQR